MINVHILITKGRRYHIELRHLDYFLVLSKELHFTRAAEKLGISQPTLSHQIKILEQDIGSPLFNRVGKKIDLTQAGEIVQKETLNIQRSLKNMSSQIEAFKEVELGELKIAVLPGEMTELISTLCIEFNKLYPNVKISIITTDEVEKTVLENQADFGIGFYFEKDHLQVVELYEEEFYFLSNKFREKETIPFSVIYEQLMVLFPIQHQCRRIIDKISENIGRKITPVVETSSIDSLLNLVRNGTGMSIVSRTLYEIYDTTDLYYQYIKQPRLTRTVNLAMKQNAFISYPAKIYLKLLITELEKLRFCTSDKEIQELQTLL